MNNLIQFAMESIRKEIKNEHNLLSIRTQSFFVDIFAENILALWLMYLRRALK